MTFRYPCTGPTPTDGFAPELTTPRANLQAFARDLGTTFGAPRITLTNSGSSANLAAALALRERAGGRRRAIVAGFTFPTTVASLLAAGFEVDVVDTDGFNLDPAALARTIDAQTGVVCVTHFLGFPARLDAIAGIARSHGALLLQDACEAMELRVAGAAGHERGALTTWSFYHPHHLSSFGGGAVIAIDEETQRIVESVTHWGRACTCHVPGLACRAPEGAAHQFTYVRPGHNLEMSELNAAFGRFQLRTWSAQESARRERYAILFEALAGKRDSVVYAPPEGSGSPFVFPFTVGGDAAPLAAKLASRGVEARTLMGGAIVDQPAYAALANDGLARTRDLARRSLFVGVHQTLPLEDVRDVARILSEELPR